MQNAVVLGLEVEGGMVSLKTGVTKHRNGPEWDGMNRNEPEWTGMNRNETGMDRNGPE